MKKRLLKILTIYTISIIILVFGVKLLINVDYKCITKELFHIYCPGCGTTRMLNSLLNFNVLEAFRYNPVMFILSIISSIYIIYISIIYIIKDKIILPNIKILYLIVAILIIFMILRNIPEFSFLRPE